MKSADVLKVIKNFEKLPLKTRLSEKGLNMGECGVTNFLGICNTTMCHGGWYAAVAIKNKFLKTFHYQDGANKMAQDLGFKHMSELSEWAMQNPELWGNESGSNMFASKHAFLTDKEFGATCLEDIIEHWRGVYQRLLVKENTGKYPDITKELAVLPTEEKVDTKEVKSVDIIV